MEPRTNDVDAPIVTGGTGTLGKLVVARLLEAGKAVRVLSRRSHDAQGIESVTGDLATGDGIAAAVAGIDVVVHCAGSAKGDETPGKAAAAIRAGANLAPEHAVGVRTWEAFLAEVSGSQRAARHTVGGV